MKKLFLVLMAICLTFLSCKNDTDTASSPATYYYVTFETYGGSSVESQKIESGKTCTKPENPTKSSGTETNFSGWYTDSSFSSKFDFSTVITKDTVLYALWSRVPEGSYLVSFDSNGGSDVESQVVEEGSYASEPENVTKTGCALSHWYESDESEEFDFSQNPITQTTELNAKWNKSGIYEADFEDESLYCMNVYEDLDAEEAL